MKIAILSDSHAGSRGDSTAFMNYFDKFFYDVFFPYLEEHNISTIYHLGDIVDKRKYINYLSAQHLRKFVKTCDMKNIELNVILGNHDLYHKNSSDVNAMRELFSDSKLKINFYQKAQEVDIDGLKVAVIPWIHSGNYHESMKFIENTTAQIAFGHLEISGFSMYKGSVNEHGFSRKIFDKFDMVMTGHFHHRSSDGHIYYVGAPFEMTWSDWNDERGFHIFDTETRELTYVRNPFSMFHKIVYNDSVVDEYLEQDWSKIEKTYVKMIVQEKKDEKKFDSFFDKLQKSNPLKLQVIEDSNNIEMNGEELDFESEDTLKLMRAEVQGLDTSINKSRLEDLIVEVYNESLMVDKI